MKFTDKILLGKMKWSRSYKEEIRKKDHEQLMEKCAGKAPLIAEMERQIGWAKLGDAALECSTQEDYTVLE